MFVLLYIFFVKTVYDVNCITSSTLSQKERIRILRHEIKKEISEVGGRIDDDDTSEENKDYFQAQRMPITPIMGAKKPSKKLLFPKLSKSTSKKLQFPKLSKSTSKTRTSTEKPAITFRDVKIDSKNGSLRSKNKTLITHKRIHYHKPIEIFYRRNFIRDFIDNPSEWVHCQDMITPYLTGVKKDIENPTRLTAKDPTVQRFLQLLTMDTSMYGRDDIYSILYQINNLQLRLFQWEVDPLNMLLNVVIKEQHHHFGKLKSGIRELFRNWRMDITNITNLLKQTRIFRPPCIQISKYDGSTKAPKITVYTKKDVATKCDDDDDDC